ncbi:hypothetical protein, partial [Chishuiella sp.]|uniref:hypothetical protein n=1 Tax=Chishuiella sp. TaxID=1969467 RepID=UPI0028AB86F5
MSIIIGEKEPIVQVKYIYKLNELLLTSSLNPDVKYVWYFYRKGKNGTWDNLGIKKEGKEVPYFFTEKSLGRNCMFKVYAILSNKSELIGEFHFLPRKNSEQKIKRVTLFNRGAKDINKASYADTLIAKAECVGMYGKKILFHLWESSAKTDEHNAEINKTKKSYPAYVNEHGIAEAKIPLSSDENVQKNRIEHFMSNGVTEKSNNEYYVTATYDGSDLVANKVNVEVTQEKKI